MAKITLIGAGSTVFAKNLMGDILSYPELANSTISLFDIDGERLKTSEIVAHKLAEERLVHDAFHDSLTDLPNRALLLDRISQRLRLQKRRHDSRFALLFLDVDGFKLVNDSMGHQAGDQMLIALGRRLASCVSLFDTVSRLGGDEFVVLLDDVDDPSVVVQVAEQVMSALRAPFQLNGFELVTTASIGIAIGGPEYDSAEALLRDADIAMYHAKTAGRNNCQFFASRMNEASAERLTLENALREALSTSNLISAQFSLHFQPQYHLASRRIISVEALARWNHPILGSIPPVRFIPLAEETGLIQALGDWVFWESCRQLRSFKDQGIEVRVAVNLSAQQLRHEALPSVVRGALACFSLDPSDLELEITESTAMQNPELTVRILEQLSGMGIILAIDDFGTGYSSLAYLKHLPIQRLKLDRSFVKDIETDINDAAICSATVALGHNLGLELVAEGVETEPQKEFLTRLGCDVLQGFLYSRPLPAEAMADFLRNLAK